MERSEDALAWERRRATPAALSALVAIGFVIAAIVVASQGVGSGDGDAELLRNVDAHRTAQLVSSILQAIGIALLAVPLYYLFRATQARSPTVRRQLVGVVIAAPLFLAVLAILSGVSLLQGATDFVNDQLPMLEARDVPLNGDRADDLAADAISDAPVRSLAAGFGLAGQIGFVVAMVYTCLHAMRTGLLTRFWGSLGMALGAVSFIFFQFTLLWFVYFGLMLLGWAPGGRPPAWETGKAEPWPTPAERAAADLEGPGAEPGQPADGVQGPGPVEPGAVEPGEPRRKRKQRD